jgi:hypothetical protein
MAAYLKIPFETLVELVQQLTLEEQQFLVDRIQGRIQQKSLTVEEKLKLFRSAQIDAKVLQEPSPRREDWYDDNGR